MKKFSLNILLIALLVLLSGCTGKGPKPIQEVDENLPPVKNIKVIEDMSSIGFEWTTVLDSNIAGYVIYRSKPSQEDNKLDVIAKVDDKYSNHFVDYDLKPNTKYRYRFAVYTDEGTRGPGSKTITAQTMPMVEPISFIKAIDTLPRKSKIIWRPHSSRSVASYIIERKVAGEEWREIAEVEHRLSAEYIDSDLEDNSVFQYRVRVKLYNGLISAASESVTTQTKPLPPKVTNLSASVDQPKKITLEWDSVTLEDFDYYKVYKKRVFWSYYAKTDKTTFVDEIDKDGHSSEYKITVVDEDELESLDSAIVRGTTLDKPQAPKIDLIKMDEKSIYIKWRPTDERAQSYVLTKNGEVILNNLTNTVYTDKEVEPGREYRYSVVAVDQYGLQSRASEQASLFLPLIVSE